MALFELVNALLKLPEALVIDEANKKLVNTWCNINNVLSYIHEFDFVDGRVKITTIKPKKTAYWITPESFELFLPEAGLYKSKLGFPILIQKMPVKQWHKSYKDTYYKVTAVGDIQLESDYLVDVFTQKREDIMADSMKRIWYWDKQIGFLNDKEEVCCTNHLYKQELIDWSRYAEH